MKKHHGLIGCLLLAVTLSVAVILRHDPGFQVDAGDPKSQGEGTRAATANSDGGSSDSSTHRESAGVASSETLGTAVVVCDLDGNVLDLQGRAVGGVQVIVRDPVDLYVELGHREVPASGSGMTPTKRTCMTDSAGYFSFQLGPTWRSRTAWIVIVDAEAKILHRATISVSRGHTIMIGDIQDERMQTVAIALRVTGCRQDRLFLELSDDKGAINYDSAVWTPATSVVELHVPVRRRPDPMELSITGDFESSPILLATELLRVPPDSKRFEYPVNLECRLLRLLVPNFPDGGTPTAIQVSQRTEPSWDGRISAVTQSFADVIVPGNGRWKVFGSSANNGHHWTGWFDAAVTPAAVAWMCRIPGDVEQELVIVDDLGVAVGGVGVAFSRRDELGPKDSGISGLSPLSDSLGRIVLRGLSKGTYSLRLVEKASRGARTAKYLIDLPSPSLRLIIPRLSIVVVEPSVQGIALDLKGLAVFRRNGPSGWQDTWQAEWEAGGIGVIPCMEAGAHDLLVVLGEMIGSVRVNVERGNGVQRIAVPMQAATSFGGRLVGADGRPLAGRRVALEELDGGSVAGLAACVTGADGSYNVLQYPGCGDVLTACDTYGNPCERRLAQPVGGDWVLPR